LKQFRLLCYLIPNSAMKYILSLWIILNFTLLSGQNFPLPDLEWGPLLQQPIEAKMAGIVTDSACFYAWRYGKYARKGDEMYLEKYNEDGSLSLYRKLKMNPGEAFRKFFSWKGGKVALVEGKEYVRLIAVNEESLAPGSEILYVKKEKDQYWQNVEVDPTQGRLLILLRERKGWQQRVRLRLIVLDQDMEVCWDEDTMLPYVYAEYYPEKVIVSPEGDVFITGYTQFAFERSVDNGKPNFQFIILSFTGFGKIQTEFQIGLRRKIVTDFNVSLSSEGKLIGVGFYSESRTAAAGGVFLTNIDPYRQTATGGKLHAFSKAFDMGRVRLGQKFEWNELSNNKGEFLHYYIRNFLPDTTGGGILIAEQVILQENYISFKEGYNGNQINYNFNDLLIIKLSQEGQVSWVKKIPKKQRTLNDKGKYSSISAIPATNENYLIYNDNGKNFSKNNKIRTFKGLQSVIALTHIDENGNTESFPIAINEEQGVLFQPGLTSAFGRNKKIIYGEKGKNFRFGILTF